MPDSNGGTENKNLARAADNAALEETMGTLEFEVCRQDSQAGWIVRLDNAEYGSYLDKEQALLDAMDAARDAQQTGRDAQVWLRGDDSNGTARIL